MNQNWTGERLETFVYNSNTIEHLHRYAITLDFAIGKTVLDIACGEGYGSNLIADYAEKVIGVDIDEETIKKAKLKYKKSNIEFRTGRADLIPLPDQHIDVVVSFETLEHHDQHNQMMEEIKRILKPGGILIISTPDKKYYSDETGNKNPFHIKELYEEEFRKLIRDYFTHSCFYAQNIFKGSLLIPDDGEMSVNIFNGDYDYIEKAKPLVPLYFIAIASDSYLHTTVQLSGFSDERISQASTELLMSDIRNEAIAWVKNSKSFKLGNALLRPFKFFKK